MALHTALLLLSLATPPAQAGGAQPVTPAYQGNCQAPAWSRNGHHLAYEVNYHQRKVIELYVYTPGSAQPRRVQPMQRGASTLTAGFGGPADTVAHEASWGPAFVDRFVYSASNTSRDYDLYLDQAGAIASAPGTDGGPAWSPDGRYIAFSSARTGQGDIYLIDAHQIDAPPRRLTSDATSSELDAAWAPDASRLAFVGHSDNGDSLWVIDDIQAGTARRVVPWTHTQTRPSFSPDGKWLAFYSDHTQQDRFDLYAVAADGGAAPVLLAKGVVMNARGPAWTPDSLGVIYVQDDDAHFDPVFRVNLSAPVSPQAIATGTVGNGDLDVIRGTDGNTWLAVAAQGRVEDPVRDYKRIFVMQLP